MRTSSEALSEPRVSPGPPDPAVEDVVRRLGKRQQRHDEGERLGTWTEVRAGEEAGPLVPEEAIPAPFLEPDEERERCKEGGAQHAPKWTRPPLQAGSTPRSQQRTTAAPSGPAISAMKRLKST